MSLKSEKLKEAVYYLIADNSSVGEEMFVNDVTKRLAADLMVNGAKVYIMGENTGDGQSYGTSVDLMGDYIKVINKRFIQNAGKYQRVLIIQSENVTDSGNMEVAVYHYNKSSQGQRFAQNIQNVFKEKSISNRTSEEPSLIFEDKNTLFLAKNMLPAISLLTVKGAAKTSENKIFIKPDKKEFANLISNGIINDYADVEFEN